MLNEYLLELRGKGKVCGFSVLAACWKLEHVGDDCWFGISWQISFQVGNVSSWPLYSVISGRGLFWLSVAAQEATPKCSALTWQQHLISQASPVDWGSAEWLFCWSCWRPAACLQPNRRWGPNTPTGFLKRCHPENDGGPVLPYSSGPLPPRGLANL